MTEEPEVVAVSTTAAIVPVTPGALVAPVASTRDIAAVFREYVALRDVLLQPDDYQSVGRDGRFVKKAGWRKLATAMGVSLAIVREEETRDDAGRILRAKVVARAIAPNGRYVEGLGVCDAHERCCPARTASVCRDARKQWHTCCPPDCDGTRHFSKPEHDIPATASTRATNRACSDLFGFGEVSAEELGTGPASADAPHIDRQRANALRDRVVATADPALMERVKAEFSWPWTVDTCATIERLLDGTEIVDAELVPPDAPPPEMAPAAELGIDDRMRRRIMAMCNERGVDEEHRHALVRTITDGRTQSTNEITQHEAVELVDYLKTLPKLATS